MAKPQKITLRLPKKQTVELTVAQAADVMNQLFDIFGPPPPTLVLVFIGVPSPVLDHGAVPQPKTTATGGGNCRCPVCTAFAGMN